MVSEEQTRKYYIFGLKIIADFGATIAIPVVVLSKFGRYLDKTRPLSHWPWYTIFGFALAALITSVMIYKKAKKYGGVYQSLDKKE